MENAFLLIEANKICSNSAINFTFGFTCFECEKNCRLVKCLKKGELIDGNCGRRNHRSSDQSEHVCVVTSRDFYLTPVANVFFDGGGCVFRFQRNITTSHVPNKLKITENGRSTTKDLLICEIFFSLLRWIREVLLIINLDMSARAAFNQEISNFWFHKLCVSKQFIARWSHFFRESDFIFYQCPATACHLYNLLNDNGIRYLTALYDFIDSRDFLNEIEFVEFTLRVI